MSKLILVRGCPGSGKTSFVSNRFKGIAHYENDMFFMHDGNYEYDRLKMTEAIGWCVKNIENCLSCGMDVVVSNTFTKRNFIESYKNIAEKYKSNFEVYRMMGDFKNVHDVPKHILENMKNNFDDYDGEFFVYPKENFGEYEISNVRI